MKKCSTGRFQGSETVLCGTVMVDTGDYALIKTNGPYNRKSKPQGQL